MKLDLTSKQERLLVEAVENGGRLDYDLLWDVYNSESSGKNAVRRLARRDLIKLENIGVWRVVRFPDYLEDRLSPKAVNRLGWYDE